MLNESISIQDLYAKCVERDWGWIIVGAFFHSPWRDQGSEGFEQEQVCGEITDEITGFFRDNGWCLELSDTGILHGTPIIPITPPEFLYHLTPYSNVKSIRERGLLTGAEAGQETSGRKYCRNAVYVFTTRENAVEWVQKKLFEKSGHKEWAILRFRGSTLTGRVYRDPASQTGYILEDRGVPDPELVDRIT
jgi:hypothetical protein